MLGEYFYYGPVSSLQVRGQRCGVRLVSGARVRLSSADPRVARLIARGHLVAAETETAGEQFPASAPTPDEGKTKKQRARRKRSKVTQKVEQGPPASEPSMADADAGGAVTDTEPSTEPELTHD